MEPIALKEADLVTATKQEAKDELTRWIKTIPTLALLEQRATERYPGLWNTPHFQELVSRRFERDDALPATTFSPPFDKGF